MTEEEELALAVQKAIDHCGDDEEISPAWVATQVMTDIEFSRSLHRLGYAGCHLELRQMARVRLRKRFDPADAEEDPQQEMFPSTLQKRYPRRPRANEEPVYAPIHSLSDDDIAFNVERMRRGALALQKHANRLEAWNANRRGAA